MAIGARGVSAVTSGEDAQKYAAYYAAKNAGTTSVTINPGGVTPGQPPAYNHPLLQMTITHYHAPCSHTSIRACTAHSRACSIRTYHTISSASNHLQQKAAHRYTRRAAWRSSFPAGWHALHGHARRHTWVYIAGPNCATTSSLPRVSQWRASLHATRTRNSRHTHTTDLHLQWGARAEEGRSAQEGRASGRQVQRQGHHRCHANGRLQPEGTPRPSPLASSDYERFAGRG